MTAGQATPRRRAGERVPFHRHLLFLLRRLPAVVLVLMLPLALAWGYLKLKTPLYKATASVFADISAPGGDARSAYMAMATGSTVLDAVMARGDTGTDLKSLPSLQWGETLVNRLMELRGQPVPAPGRGELRDRLRATIAAVPSNEANVLDLSVRATDAGAAQRLANAVAGVLVTEIGRQFPAAGQPGPNRREELRQALEAAEKRLAEAKSAPMAGTGMSRAAQLRARLETVQAALNSGQNLERAAGQITSPGIERLRSLYSEALAQEFSLRASLGARHPSTLEAQQLVEDKRKLLAEGLRIEVTNLAADAQKAEADERNSPPSQPAAQQPDPQLPSLQEAVRVARNAYEQSLRGGDAGPSAVARVLRPAVTPASPDTPGAMTIWLGALLAGLLLAALAAWRALKRWRLWSDEQLRALPRRPVEAERMAEPEPEQRLSTPLSRPQAAGELARDMSEKATTAALQTILVTGSHADDIAEAALEIAGEVATQHLRVLLLDSSEANPALSRLLRDAPVSGHILLNGRQRILASIEPKPNTPVWLAPALSSLATTPARDLPLIVPSLAGHFDCLIISGPVAGPEAGFERLAQASDTIVCTGRPGPLLASSSAFPVEKLRLYAKTPRQNRRSGRVIRLDIAS